MDLHENDLAQQIRSKALELGFMAAGFSKTSMLSNEEIRLKQWIQKGYHSDMNYMTRYPEKRVNPALLVQGTKSIVSLLYNYFPSCKPACNDSPVIARYAYGRDYHDVIKPKLSGLFDYIKTLRSDVEGRWFVDSAPVLERALAQRAGLGWIGKNTHLIHPQFGSYFFIAELFINIELPEDKPIDPHCGNCTRCLDACPTQALVEPGVLDARKCIAWLTIENKGSIPDEFEGMMQNRVFGCDICQEVCPWNRKTRPHCEPSFEPNPELLLLTSDQWKNMNEEDYQKWFQKSAVKRAKYSGLKRNLEFLYRSSALKKTKKSD